MPASGELEPGERVDRDRVGPTPATSQSTTLARGPPELGADAAAQARQVRKGDRAAHRECERSHHPYDSPDA